MITIKLANGKVLESENGEEVYHFFNSDGRSIVPEPPKQPKEKPQK